MTDKIQVSQFENLDELKKITSKTDKLISCLVFFKTESGKININLKIFEIQEHSVVNLPILSSVNYNEINQNAKGWCITFNKEARDIFLVHSFKLFCPFTGIIQTKIGKSRFTKFDFYFQEIRNELINNEISSSEIIYLQTALIIKYLNRNINENNSEGQISDKTVKEFADLVDAEFKNNHGIEYYSLKLGISSKTLSRLTKQSVNLNPKQIIAYRINAEAIKLLIHTNLSIKETAYELNFNSPDYFNYFFKRINNISPSAYKNKMSENLSFLVK